jgi:hypothetical protein
MKRELSIRAVALVLLYTHKAASVAALVASAHMDPVIAARAWDIDFGQWKPTITT